MPLQFSFSDPGARSLSLGGAFVALADDATAAFANPAGLVQLLRPEVSIEGRSWSYSTPYTVGGRAEGLPSGFGIDNTVGLRTATSNHDATGFSFLSLAYPKGNWSFALFRHELADLEFSSETQGLFGGGTNCCQTRQFDQRSMSDLSIVGYGFSTAYRVGENFNLGLGIVYYDASFISDATVYGPDDDTVASIFAPNSYLPERLVLREQIFFDDTDWAVSVGLLWRLSQGWSIGGVYRQAPEFNIDFELTAGEIFDPGVPPGTVLFRGSSKLELPEIYGLGLAYRSAGGRFTLTFQWNRVEYSRIVDSLALDDRAIDDVDQLHLGVEYVFLDLTPIFAVRLGTWLEPDHQLRATGDDPFARALLPPGDDEFHFAFGLGTAMQNFQIDLGVDIADHVDTVSLSAILSF
ncbi:MAG: hypothetical protein QNJ73_09680 [Gammaproteobacteria bacterium]|nr:hypothetical protein [Gammaproteobacteria bacterium]